MRVEDPHMPTTPITTRFPETIYEAFYEDSLPIFLLMFLIIVCITLLTWTLHHQGIIRFSFCTRRHLPIDPTYPHPDGLLSLTPNCYSPSQALHHLISILTYFHACPDRQDCASHYKAHELWDLSVQKDLFELEMLKQERSILTRYFNYFNRLFFSSGLQEQNCSLIFVPESDKQHKECVEVGLWGATQIVNNKKCNILIYEIAEEDPEKRAREYVGVLLHEMLHVFFHLYTCHCQKCDRRTYETNGYGHGKQWQRAAKLLEVFLASELNTNINLMRYASLGREIAISGKSWTPLSDAELKLLGMKRGNVENWGRHYTKQIEHGKTIY
ncbi:hypothetical protein B0O99DRAFT_703451 [Bisporella sp. PMI_857]|nr:hypothetical protein B0O99DRAFT_703451 [Bisporella sp. PMI_857]